MSDRAADPVNITLGAGLDWSNLDDWLGRRVKVSLTPEGLERASIGRGWVESLIAGGETVYGLNTGFGALKNTRIKPEQLELLQENLLVSHAVGVGPPAPPEVVRWMLLFKIQMLLRGHSGVRPETIQRLAEFLSADQLPLVPTHGSLGASGDLAPLAHLCLPLIGRGLFLQPQDHPREARSVLAKHNWQPLKLAAKEGLALINGTQFMSAYAAVIGVRARRLVELADLILCMSLEATRGSVRPADARLHDLRPHPGSRQVAENIRFHMRDSAILESHRDCDRVQDPYSLRCAPQVHGAVRDALAHFQEVVLREIQSVTDNPILVDAAAGAGPQAISGGNFHGAPLGYVLDYLAIALTDLANISERRTYLLLSGIDGLPPLLMKDTGLNSGFMIAQYTSAALLNQCKVLSSPASVDSIPTSLNQEDHVSMGATGALKCFEILDRAEHVLAIEMLCAAQGIDFRLPLAPGFGPRAAHSCVRKHVSHATQDREFGLDIRTCVDLLRNDVELRFISRRLPAG